MYANRSNLLGLTLYAVFQSLLHVRGFFTQGRRVVFVLKPHCIYTLVVDGPACCDSSGEVGVARYRRLLLDALLLGLAGGLCAQVFTFLLAVSQSLFLEGMAGYHPPGLPDEGGVLREVVGAYGLWLIPISTTVGGLISGLLVFSLAPEAEGHGTDSVVRAYHKAGGFIRYRVPAVKMIASAITIGSGGAAGREGPTALITAGLGSMDAAHSSCTSEDMRVLTLIGMAVGLSAIFRSPIGCAVFAVEVLYRDVEYESSALF